MPFADLPPDFQHANLAAARRIPIILDVAGLRTVWEDDGVVPLTEAEVMDTLDAHIEAAAIAGHEGRMAEKIGSGWKYGPERDDEAKIQPSIIPYADLSEVEKEKDCSAVRNFSTVIRRAGMGVAGSWE